MRPVLKYNILSFTRDEITVLTVICGGLSIIMHGSVAILTVHIKGAPCETKKEMCAKKYMKGVSRKEHVRVC